LANIQYLTKKEPLNDIDVARMSLAKMPHASHIGVMK